MSEQNDRRVWDIGGHEVTFLHIDHRFSFECWWPEHNRLYVVIETPFEVIYPDHTVICVPEVVNSLKEALSILHKPVSTLTAFRDGRLLIIFSDTTKIEVSKHLDYEAWEARGEGQLQDLALLCSPHSGPAWRE